uniref:AAA_8 domain-containing protein n=1 Tax=Caenorhabditis tropicalis TaxID=1561998 RepID=A0A1I7TTT4_9PELO
MFDLILEMMIQFFIMAVLGNSHISSRTRVILHREFFTSVQTHLPDPSLSKENYEESDVFNMINRFMNSSIMPICGSRVLVLVKRYPGKTDTTELVAKLQQYHVEITFVTTTNSFGVNDPSSLYKLASETNGLCFLDNNDELMEGVKAAPSFINPYLLYAVNPTVSGSGTIQLPSLFTPEEGNDYWITMTVHDDSLV